MNRTDTMHKRSHLLFYLLFAMLLLLVILSSCYKDPPVPENPYKKINYNTPPPPVDTLDPSSFVAIHRDILSTKCAVPACHDGNFEPDYRSVQSSYATLVYQPINKNNSAKEFTYRVVPFDTSKSVLYERITNCCFVNINDRMPQDNIGVPLPDKDIQAIGKWIMGGSKDMFGQNAVKPDKEPNILYYVAVNTTFNANFSGTQNRIDSIYYNPFMIDKDTSMIIAVFVKDDQTKVKDMTFNKLRMSLDSNNFSPSAPGYREYSTTYFMNPGDSTEFFYATVNTADYPPGDVVYMRYYTNDGGHSQPTEFPVNSSILPYKTFWSFYVKP
jgi:hypothetical protein